MCVLVSDHAPAIVLVYPIATELIFNVAAGVPITLGGDDMPRSANGRCEQCRQMQLATRFKYGRKVRGCDSWDSDRLVIGFNPLWNYGFDDFILTGSNFETRVGDECCCVVVLSKLRCLVTRGRSRFFCDCENARQVMNTLELIGEEHQ